MHCATHTASAYQFFSASNISQRFLLRKMAGPKMAYDFSPSVKISDVISSIKELHFGTAVNIDEKFLNELKSVLQSKIVPANSDVGSFENFGGHPAMKKSSGGTGSKWELPNQGIETRLNAYGPFIC